MFTDVGQYLGVAKEFANIGITKVRNMPSWVYPWIMGPFLKIWPSLYMARFFNNFWLLADGLLLFLMTRNKKSFILFMFAPIVWYMSTWINPILPISFLLLFAYWQFKLYEEDEKKINFILSALALGLVSSLWGAGIYLSLFFIFAFFYNRKLINILLYLIPFFVTFSIRLILDWYYFGFPFFSIIRSVGSNFMFFTGQSLSQTMETGFGTGHYIFNFILLFFIISPLIYRLYKLEFSEYKSEIIFLGLATLLFVVNLQLRYFIVLAPLYILLLYPFVKKKGMFIHIFISLVLIIFLTHSYFGETKESLIVQDLDRIAEEFPDERFIVGGEGVSEEQALTLGTLYWGDKIKEFIWYNDYKLSLENKDLFREYSFDTKSRINNVRKLRFGLGYYRTDNKTYEDVKYLILIGDEGEVSDNFKFVKKYNRLNLYRRV
jgi:hypothetical protein